MADGELLELQVAPEVPRPTATATKTDMLLVPTRMADRLAHFPEEVYDLSAESHLSKLLKVLLGDAGAGQLRKRLLITRMQNTLQGTHFYDLDRFYGPLFGLRRGQDEVFDLDPYTETAVTETWDEVTSKDASFRSRIEQFSKALAYGATPTGMELVAEALLAVDCDIHESYIQADESYQTYAELEDQYGGNLLTENQESLETDLTGWGAGANTTLARSTAWAYSGVASLELTAAALGDISAVTPSGAGGIAVTPGEAYSFTTAVGPNAAGRAVRVEIDWYDGAAALLSTSAGTPVTESTTGSVGPEVTATAPAGAATAAVRFVVEAAAAGEAHRADGFTFSPQTYADMEGTSYGTLEGAGLARMSGDERRVFTIRPKRRISLSEAYDLRRVLSRIKPADSRFVIDHSGIPLHAPLTIGSATADSVHWEVISSVAPISSPLDPYQVSTGTLAEQPRPPFSGYQGEAWSYNADLVGMAASYKPLGGERRVLPVQRVTFPDGTAMDFSPQQAVLPRRMVLGGRAVSDGILVAHPYAGPRGVPTLFEDRYVVQRSVRDIARLYADGIPLDPLNALLKSQAQVDPYQQNPQHRFWVSGERWMDDPAEETLEVRLAGDRLINYITFETSRFPHQVVAEVYETSMARWVEVHRRYLTDSNPRLLSHDSEVTRRGGHPLHSSPNHWERISVRIPAMTGSRFRLRMQRIEGVPPKTLSRAAALGAVRQAVEVPYSLGVRSLDLGYRVTSRADFDFLDPEAGGVLGQTRDVAGSSVQFTVKENSPQRLLEDEGHWRCEPQPVNYAVVNLYLDTRGGGDGTVIDRFFLDPTHVGPHFTLYYSNDPQETDGTDAFYEERGWTPIPRDYTLQKGYVHLPPTRARYWKFEFTNLVAEPYESFLAINRKVRLFPRALVESMHREYGQARSEVPTEMLPAIEAVRESRYSDALTALGVPEVGETRRHLATESLYIPDLSSQQRLRSDSWVFGFTPWHQGEQAPRFAFKGRHVYDETEVRHSSKVAFFVGLKSIEAYRTRWEEDDDTQVYLDTFDDFRNLEPGFTWAFEPGALTTAGTPGTTVEAMSRTFSSLHNVEAVQFATEQSSAVQVVPDHDFRDPTLATYQWDDPDHFLKVGDAQLIYSEKDHSVLHLRYVVPPPKPVARTGGLVQPVFKPVFLDRPYEVADEEAAAATEGGIASPLLGLSPDGRAYAAARFTVDCDLTNPLYLQVVDANNADAVLIERPVNARRGETVEEYVAFDIPGPNTVVRVRLVQQGKSNDAWRLDTLSMFDEGITWEFSVNGGGDWYPARGIRNNDNGVLTFPEVGNQLKFRVRGHRPDQWVSAIKVRPWYVGTKNVRPGGTHRGPNVSTYDHDVPIHEDPLFTSWKKPIPYWWFAASRRYPMLPVEGIPNITEFARFYGRPTEDTVAPASDEVASKTLQVRSAEDWIAMEGDWAERPLPLDWRIHGTIVRPVGLGHVHTKPLNARTADDAAPVVEVADRIVAADRTAGDSTSTTESADGAVTPGL